MQQQYDQNNFQEALRYFQQGFDKNCDPLCSYKLAEYYSNQQFSKDAKITNNKELSLFYYICASSLGYLYYSDDLINTDIMTEISQQIQNQTKYQICEYIVNKNIQLLPQNKSKYYQQFIISSFQFQYSDNQQQLYNNLIIQWKQQLIYEDTDPLPGIFMIQIMQIYTLNSSKQLNQIITTFLPGNSQNKVINSAKLLNILSIMYSQALTYTQCSQDNTIFVNFRNQVLEIYQIIKSLLKDENYNKINGHYQQISQVIYQLITILYDNQQLISTPLHKTLLIRFKSELHEKGIGTNKNTLEAINLIQQELNIKKSNQNLYAYANYQIGKLKQHSVNENPQLIPPFFISASEQFQQRADTGDIYVQLISNYYLGRINMIFYLDLKKSEQYFQKSIDIYKQNSDKFQQTRTLQYELIIQKCNKKIEKFELTKAISNRVSHQSQREKNQIIQKANQNQNQENFQQQYQQQNMAQQTIEEQQNNSNINIENQPNLYSVNLTQQKKQEELKQQQLQQGRISFGNGAFPQISQQNKNNIKVSDLSSLMSEKLNLVQKEGNFLFYDNRLVLITNFLSKNEFGTTNEGILLLKKLNETQQSLSNINTVQDKYNYQQLKQSSYFQQEGQNNTQNNIKSNNNQQQKQIDLHNLQYNDDERIIIKSFSFMRKDYFDKIFYHLVKMSKIKGGPGILSVMGLSITELDDQDSFSLQMIYPKLDYNLYGLLKQNILVDIQDKLSTGLKIAESLKNLHDHNIFHGNLKPTNILIKQEQEIQDSEVFINDWEFTQKFSQKQQLINFYQQNDSADQSMPNNNNTTIQGTVDEDGLNESEPFYSYGYVSPEQIVTIGPKTSIQSDIWTLGMILNYIFFDIEPIKQPEFIQSQKLYQGNNISTKSYYTQGTNEYLDKISVLIENMVVYQENQRWKIQKVRNLLLQLLMKIKTDHQEIKLDVQQPGIQNKY